MSTPLDILIVDKNEERLRLFSQALAEYPQFLNIHHATDFQQALHRMATVYSCDAVFLFENTDLKQIASFVNKSRKTDAGKICSFVLVIRPEEAPVQEISKYAEAGIDGFLFQPIDEAKIASIKLIINKALHEQKISYEKKMQYKGASELLRRKFEAKKKDD